MVWTIRKNGGMKYLKGGGDIIMIDTSVLEEIAGKIEAHQGRIADSLEILTDHIVTSSMATSLEETVIHLEQIANTLEEIRDRMKEPKPPKPPK